MQRPQTFRHARCRCEPCRGAVVRLSARQTCEKVTQRRVREKALDDVGPIEAVKAVDTKRTMLGRKPPDPAGVQPNKREPIVLALQLYVI